MMTIVYVSNAGHTEQYAEMLSRKTRLKSLNINDAVKILPKGSSILLMGWVMGDSIQGYKKLCKLFNIKGICAVGMSKYSSKPESLRKTNSLPDDMPLFVLPAGIDVNKLHGFYKLIIKMMQKSISKKNGEKTISAEEKELHDILLNGRNTVSDEHLDDVEKWLSQYDFS